MNNEQEVIKFVARTGNIFLQNPALILSIFLVNVPEPNVPISEWLKSGMILCKLLDKMVPGSVNINSKRSQMSSNENLQNFLHKCKDLGFEDHQLFEVSDLVDQKNMAKVLNCLTHIRDELLTRNKLQFYI